MARPPEKPLNMAGKWTYTRLGQKLIAYPSDVIKKDEEELIKAINTAFDKNACLYLTDEQHHSLTRLLNGYSVEI